jgi:hypothetical protein
MKPKRTVSAHFAFCHCDLQDRKYRQDGASAGTRATQAEYCKAKPQSAA